MRSVSPGRRHLLRRGSCNPLLTGVALMVLPKIEIAFPRGRRGGAKEEMGRKPSEERRTVIWEDHKLVLFDDHVFLPTVSIEFPQDEGQAGEIISDVPASLPMDMVVEEVPSDVVDGFGDEPLPSATKDEYDIPMAGLSSLSCLGGFDDTDEEVEGLPKTEEEDPPLGHPNLGLRKAIEDSDVLAEPEEVISLPDLQEAPPIYDGPTESICGGALVLIEGEKGKKARDLVQTISLGILQNGRSVTYVATAQSVQDLIMEMYEMDDHIADYLPDHRLMCVPVYPLIEGRRASEGLLDKLIGSEQLQTTDALVIDALSDFLNDRFDEMKCMHLLEHFQHLNAMGKAVFLIVNDGQKGILPLRLESELQLSIPAEGPGPVQMKRYQPSRQGASEMLRFHMDPEAGLLPHPLPQISS